MRAVVWSRRLGVGLRETRGDYRAAQGLWLLLQPGQRARVHAAGCCVLPLRCVACGREATETELQLQCRGRDGWMEHACGGCGCEGSAAQEQSNVTSQAANHKTDSSDASISGIRPPACLSPPLSDHHSPMQAPSKHRSGRRRLMPMAMTMACMHARARASSCPVPAGPCSLRYHPHTYTQACNSAGKCSDAFSLPSGSRIQIL